jgi:hypothetical protein
MYSQTRTRINISFLKLFFSNPFNFVHDTFFWYHIQMDLIVQHYLLIKYVYTKPVYKEHREDHDNVSFTSS